MALCQLQVLFAVGLNINKTLRRLERGGAGVTAFCEVSIMRLEELEKSVSVIMCEQKDAG